METLETLIEKHAVGSQFFVSPQSLGMSSDAFHALMRDIPVGLADRIAVIDVRHESQSGARRISLVKMERLE